MSKKNSKRNKVKPTPAKENVNQDEPVDWSFPKTPTDMKLDLEMIKIRNRRNSCFNSIFKWHKYSHCYECDYDSDDDEAVLLYEPSDEE